MKGVGCKCLTSKKIASNKPTSKKYQECRKWLNGSTLENLLVSIESY